MDNANILIDFLQKQFSFFEDTKLELSRIDALHKLSIFQKKQIGYCRIQIINSEVYAENNVAYIFPHASTDMFNILISSIKRILKKNNIPDVDFVFFAVDNLVLDNAIAHLIRKFPAMMMSIDITSQFEQNCLLIPDAYLLSDEMWPPLIDKINAASNKYLWNYKDSNKIFWRGATTGGTYNLNNYHKLNRLKLVMLSKSFPELIDAQFTHYCQFSDDPSGRNLFTILDKILGYHDYCPESEHLLYKYLISVDGNTAAWLRVPWILLSNSLLFLQESNFIQYFFATLKPYVHYVPIKKDLSDVFQKLEWAQNNDQQALNISLNATKLVNEVLMPKQIDQYLLNLFNRYHNLQSFRVSPIGLAKL